MGRDFAGQTHSQAMSRRPARTQRSTRGLYKLYPTRRNHREKARSCSRMCLITSSRQEITFKMLLPSFQQLSKHAYPPLLHWNFVMVVWDPWRQPLALSWILALMDTMNLHTLSIASAPHQENRALSSGCNSQEELFSLASSSSLDFLTLSCLIFNCISDSSVQSTNTASPRSPQLRHLNIMGLDHEGIALTNRPSNGFMM